MEDAPENSDLLANLRQQVTNHLCTIEDLQRVVRDLKDQVGQKDSLLSIKDLEIRELTHVVERNLMRVKSETAKYAKDIADAERPPVRRDNHL